MSPSSSARRFPTSTTNDATVVATSVRERTEVGLRERAHDDDLRRETDHHRSVSAHDERCLDWEKYPTSE